MNRAKGLVTLSRADRVAYFFFDVLAKIPGTSFWKWDRRMHKRVKENQDFHALGRYKRALDGIMIGKKVTVPDDWRWNELQEGSVHRGRQTDRR
jgi:hypothetical protein